MHSTCDRCGQTKDIGSLVRVPRDPDAVTAYHGLPDVATVTVCHRCRRAGEKYWSNCE